jgi:trimeric autotransporter adhesin
MKNQLYHPSKEEVLLLLGSLCLVSSAPEAWANPGGMTVVSGTAHATQSGNTLQITTSQIAVLQWNSFNIAAGQTTIFKQPSSTSLVFNNINNANPTTIFGSLQANGIVVLENQSGFYFGPNAFVKAGGLVISTAAINPWSGAGGAGWSFDGPPVNVPIVNYGHLETAAGGSLFLIANQIENQGTIQAPGGTAALLGGQQVLLSQRADGLGLAVPVQLPAGSVNNQGKIMADAGEVILQAQTVNNSGVIQANSMREQNGVIELYASDQINLTATSVIQANGDASGTSSGGNVTIKSSGSFSDSSGSEISATGGAKGGNGGNIEVSAPNILSLSSSINASAPPGWNEGQFSLDPENIVLGNFPSGSTSAGGGIIAATGSSGTVDVDVGTAFQNINASILLQASGNITINSGTTWDLSQSTGKTTGQLTLQAGGDIDFGTANQPAASITDENSWSVTLEAGYNFAAGQGVVPGVGSVNLAGGSGGAGSMIEMATGNITVLAGDNVTVGVGGIVTGIANGAVISGLGGNVSVQAVAGNVNCGTSTAGYNFAANGYTVNPDLGGISTAHGGNVTIQAGGSITAPMPLAGLDQDAGSGAFGPDPGNVTVTAGGNVVGHFVLADGVGIINCANAGTTGINLALSLVKGAWDVNATGNIFLQEVRNPNGVFNGTGDIGDPSQFLFDYDPQAAVTLDAGNGVTITGSGVPRLVSGREGLIFPPSLTIEAGAGGITIDRTISLFPSPTGTLDLTTTGGGSVNGNSQSIIMSDSLSDQWLNTKSFTTSDPQNYAPLHLNDPNPDFIDISGSVSDLVLDSAKPVEMFVAGNLVDSSATILNLRPADTTVISVGGELLDHSDFVILSLPTGVAPNFNALDSVAEPTVIGLGNTILDNPNLNLTLENQENQFTYDPATGGLKYEGVMSSAVEQALLAMTTPFLPAATIQQIYAQSQSETTAGEGGYNVAGPGTFRVNAGSIDLGNGGGLVSLGIAGGYAALAPYTSHGADLDISSSGNLSMVASTIESDYGGNINISCGGQLDVGSLLVPPASDQLTLGIVSLWSGNINIVANGNINVDGSRIAAYDGGNIFVESLTGDVNAGTGGGSPTLIHKYYLNAEGKLVSSSDEIPGSGILATSYPEIVENQTPKIGNITVEAPQGNIEASKGGIVQLALTPVPNNNATINVIAGSKNSDGSVAFSGDVDASGSGIIGGQVNISATGNVNGLVVASIGANVSALQNVSATVLSQGNATVTAVSGTVSGTIVGAGSVSVTGGGGISALTLGGSVSTSGATSGPAVTSAPAGSSSTSTAATSQQVAETTQGTQVADNTAESEEEKKRRAMANKLKEYIGRVTVLLPQ